jgi:hypothetical protein
MSDKKTFRFYITQNGQVTNTAGQVVTLNPMPNGGRPWIKFWVDPWLDGTTRWQTTGTQRAFWTDLLAESGRGRFPGYVCAGQDAGRAVGYPLSWFAAKQTEQFDILATFELFERTGKIRIIVTREEEPKLYALEILKWDVYQSAALTDAERARKYREGKKKP